MPLHIHITQNSDTWTTIPFLSKLIEESIQLPLRNVIGLTLEQKVFHVDVTLTDDIEMAQINQEFRGKKGATNVLSFPQFTSLEEMEPHQEILLGDIVLSYATTALEAQRENKKFTDHLTHLLVHSTLHLLGFDHTEDQEAHRMEALEIQLLSSVGISNPYLVD